MAIKKKMPEFAAFAYEYVRQMTKWEAEQIRGLASTGARPVLGLTNTADEEIKTTFDDIRASIEDILVEDPNAHIEVILDENTKDQTRLYVGPVASFEVDTIKKYDTRRISLYQLFEENIETNTEDAD